MGVMRRREEEKEKRNEVRGTGKKEENWMVLALTKWDYRIFKRRRRTRKRKTKSWMKALKQSFSSENTENDWNKELKQERKRRSKKKGKGKKVEPLQQPNHSTAFQETEYGKGKKEEGLTAFRLREWKREEIEKTQSKRKEKKEEGLMFIALDQQPETKRIEEVCWNKKKTINSHFIIFLQVFFRKKKIVFLDWQRY